MKPQVYVDPRPAEYFTRFHERVRRGRPDWAYEFVRLMMTPFVLLFFRLRVIDSGLVPASGPAIIAPNHFSYLDHFFAAVFLRRKVQFMAKSQLFTRPIQFIYSHGGVFPVRRGKGDTEAFKSAHAVLARGGVVLLYPEGGRSRTGELGDPKPGLGRLALESGAPVVPSAIAGSSGVRNWRKGRFPGVTVQYGEPMQFEHVDEPTREEAQGVSEAVFAEVRKMYIDLNRHGRGHAIRAAREKRRRAPLAGSRATLPVRRRV